MRKPVLSSLVVTVILLLAIAGSVAADQKDGKPQQPYPPQPYEVIPQCGDHVSTDTPLVLTDNSDTEPPNVPECSTITVPDTGDLVSSITVDVQMTHTWIGDLNVYLIAPDGDYLTMMCRAGAGPGCPNPGPAGDSSDLLATTITFDDAATDSAEDLGTAQGGADVIPDSTVFPFPDGDPNSLANLAAFNGKPSNGDWQLCVSDWAGGDLGSLDGWTLHMGCDMTAVELSDANAVAIEPTTLIAVLTVTLVGMTAVTLRHRRNIS